MATEPVTSGSCDGARVVAGDGLGTLGVVPGLNVVLGLSLGLALGLGLGARVVAVTTPLVIFVPLTAGDSSTELSAADKSNVSDGLLEAGFTTTISTHASAVVATAPTPSS